MGIPGGLHGQPLHGMREKCWPQVGSVEVGRHHSHDWSFRMEPPPLVNSILVLALALAGEGRGSSLPYAKPPIKEDDAPFSLRAAKTDMRSR